LYDISKNGGIMFEQIFNNFKVINHHKSVPYIEERERYLEYCKQEGYAQATLIAIAYELFWSAQKLEINPDIKINLDQIIAAANDWADRERCCRHKLNTQWTRDRFIRITRKWLRFPGCFKEPETKASPFSGFIDDFKTWMKKEQGLASSTIEVWSGYLEQFLSWIEDQGLLLETIDISDIDSFLVFGSKKGWCRVTIANRAVSLRAFFKYAETRGWCRPSISLGIQAPRIYSQETIPLGPSWEDVRRLIASMDTEKPYDIRNRAIIMLFSVYGMRASEVSKLCLSDLDWQHDRIQVPRVKRRSPQSYPLVPVVGNAIVKYLTKVRPPCTIREVFTTLKPPLGPISRSGLHSLTNRCMTELGLQLPHLGPHSLRHACANRLVTEGFTLKEIGDHLGHRSSSATAIYAKVDLARLKEVAKFDLGGLL
jgi:site-specific recombinase XerD